jgi:hypothetical protein
MKLILIKYKLSHKHPLSIFHQLPLYYKQDEMLKMQVVMYGGLGI